MTTPKARLLEWEKQGRQGAFRLDDVTTIRYALSRYHVRIQRPGMPDESYGFSTLRALIRWLKLV